MIWYNSLEVSEKLFCHEPGVLWYYETTTFCLHHNCIYSSGRIFVLSKWHGLLFKSLKIFSLPFHLLGNVVIFFTKPTGLCAITESSLENIACVLHSLQFTFQNRRICQRFYKRFSFCQQLFIVYTFQITDSGNNNYNLNKSCSHHCIHICPTCLPHKRLLNP